MWVGPNDKIVHMRAIRCYLKVNRYAAKAGIKKVLAGFHHTYVDLNVFRLWNRILYMEKPRLSRIIFDYQQSYNLVYSSFKDMKTVFSMENCTDMLKIYINI